ncbi:cytochrome C assembly family protein [Alloalcanivorax marinus]|uniref:cytochrome C assembly family protein n=1 Tax=Alloalcanivorax marinus TaxID=1177169 RepID=UPI001932D37A|nr:cytochrome c biogenesis protein CcsA [Alloalcanivorax marinus]MBL7251361.1 cytochrome c biogenesis protein CcsA [Alloalcanivorax marinus]
MSPAEALGLTATFFYALASLLVFRQFRSQSAPSTALLLAPAAVATAVHAVSLYFLMVTDQGLLLGVLPVASCMSAVGAGLVIVSSLYRPFQWIGALVFPFAALIIPASLWINTGYRVHPLEHGIGLHVLLSILAYSVLVISACQAILLLIQHRQLKDGHIRGVMRVFPPIQVMESMLFDTIWLGEALLTVAILFGFLYVDDLFAQHLVHKTVLTLASWVIFAVLLAGRHLRGWRGLTAIRFTLAGFAVLLVAFFGSQLVLEVVLGRR